MLMILLATAKMVNPASDFIPVFWEMFFLWDITVFTLIFSLSAISLPERPVTRSLSTSVSLSLSVSVLVSDEIFWFLANAFLIAAAISESL